MWWILGGAGILLYFILFFAFGIGCIQKGRWVWFIVGFVFPLVWIVGAVIGQREQPTRDELIDQRPV